MGAVIFFASFKLYSRLYIPSPAQSQYTGLHRAFHFYPAAFQYYILTELIKMTPGLYLRY